MTKHSLKESFSFALNGLIYTLKTQRNMRIHLLIGAVVLSGGLFLGLSTIEFIFLLFAVALVFVAEMANTAVEVSINLITNNEYHPLAKIVKDIAAGAVLISSLNAFIIGGIVFFKPIKAQLAIVAQIINKLFLFPQEFYVYMVSIIIGFLSLGLINRRKVRINFNLSPCLMICTVMVGLAFLFLLLAFK